MRVRWYGQGGISCFEGKGRNAGEVMVVGWFSCVKVRLRFKLQTRFRETRLVTDDFL